MTWYRWGAEQETKKVLEEVLRGAQCLCPNTVRGSRTSHGEPCSRTGKDFSKVSQIAAPGEKPNL